MFKLGEKKNLKNKKKRKSIKAEILEFNNEEASNRLRTSQVRIII